MDAIKYDNKNIVLKLKSDGSVGNLLCPWCGSDSLHHQRVQVFEREENDYLGLHVTVWDGKVKKDQDMTDNPSPRLDGLSILFWCESCEELAVLHIYQHKGRTEVMLEKVK